MQEEVLRDYSKEHALKVAEYACRSKTNFAALINCFLDNDHRLSQRAAWSVSWAAKRKPEMVMPHVKDLVAALQKKNVHDAVIRNAVRVLQDIDIPEDFHGEVMNACFQFLERPSTPAAIKAFSLTTLFNLTKKYPEIKPELQLIIKERWEHEGAAFHSRGRKILAALEKKNIKDK